MACANKENTNYFSQSCCANKNPRTVQIAASVIKFASTRFLSTVLCKTIRILAVIGRYGPNVMIVIIFLTPKYF